VSFRGFRGKNILHYIFPNKSRVLNGTPDKTFGRPYTPKFNQSMPPRTPTPSTVHPDKSGLTYPHHTFPLHFFVSFRGFRGSMSYITFNFTFYIFNFQFPPLCSP